MTLTCFSVVVRAFSAFFLLIAINDGTAAPTVETLGLQCSIQSLHLLHEPLLVFLVLISDFLSLFIFFSLLLGAAVSDLAQAA